MAVTDDLVSLAAGELVDHLGDLLGGVWLVDGQGEPHEDEESDEAAGHQDFKGEGIADGSGGVGGMNAHGLHQRRRNAAEQVIQQSRNGKCFRHEDLSLSVSGSFCAALTARALSLGAG